jgi:hypothetical protein
LYFKEGLSSQPINYKGNRDKFTEPCKSIGIITTGPFIMLNILYSFTIGSLHIVSKNGKVLAKNVAPGRGRREGGKGQNQTLISID